MHKFIIILASRITILNSTLKHLNNINGIRIQNYHSLLQLLASYKQQIIVPNQFQLCTKLELEMHQYIQILIPSSKRALYSPNLVNTFTIDNLIDFQFNRTDKQQMCNVLTLESNQLITFAIRLRKTLPYVLLSVQSFVYIKIGVHTGIIYSEGSDEEMIFYVKSVPGDATIQIYQKHFVIDLNQLLYLI